MLIHVDRQALQRNRVNDTNEPTIVIGTEENPHESVWHEVESFGTHFTQYSDKTLLCGASVVASADKVQVRKIGGVWNDFPNTTNENVSMLKLLGRVVEPESKVICRS